VASYLAALAVLLMHALSYCAVGTPLFECSEFVLALPA
jgi:hypothetical protein